MNRGRLWLYFWLLFIATPAFFIATMAGRNSKPELPFSILFLGSILAGFVLSKLFAKTEAGFILLGALFSAGILAVYVGVAFVGCVVGLRTGQFHT